MAINIGNPLKKLLDRARGKAKNRADVDRPLPGEEDKTSGGENIRLIKLEKPDETDKPDKADKREKLPDAPAPKVMLSGPLLAALSLVLVCAVAWAFFMGLMVGRGQNPQESLPAMAGMLESPAPENPAPEFPEKPDLAELPQGEGETQGPSGVLPLPVPGAAASVHAPPTGAASQAWPQAEQKPRPKPKPAAPAVVDNRKYDYVYQVAAFRSNADASKAQKAINGKGLRATVRKSGRVYLVMANFRGTPAEMDRVLARMRSQGMTKPMQLSKLLVEPKPARQKKKN